MKPTFKNVYDLSVTLGEESSVYPGDQPYLFVRTESIASGNHSNVSRLEMSAHSGTHLDLPLHFIDEARPMQDCSARDFILPARVLAVEEGESVRLKALSGIEIEPGEALLFQTKNSRSGLTTSGEFSERYVHLAPEVGQYCVEKKVALVGVDYMSVDPFDSQDFPVHNTLLGHGIPILENLNLRDVPEGCYTLICLPLKMADAEASPVRAVLVT